VIVNQRVTALSPSEQGCDHLLVWEHALADA
jgi:hypothetical protein